jgi:hypothetical protein
MIYIFDAFMQTDFYSLNIKGYFITNMSLVNIYTVKGQYYTEGLSTF